MFNLLLVVGVPVFVDIVVLVIGIIVGVVVVIVGPRNLTEHYG